MEKKGELLNQLAMISDLLERSNMETDSISIVVGVSGSEFERIFELVQSKFIRRADVPEDSFEMNIGQVNVIVNRNNDETVQSS